MRSSHLRFGLSIGTLLLITAALPGRGRAATTPNLTGTIPTAQAMAMYENGQKSLPLALMAEIVFPGAGNLYAGRYWRSGFTFGGMAAGAISFLHGMNMQLAAQDGGERSAVGQTLMLTGLVTLVGSRIFGLVSSGFSIRDHNRELKKKLGLSPSLSAAVTPDPAGGGLTYVSTLGFRF
jgi:hypothetical protein